MDTTRVIKKYPNRRLYDTAISSYITLADVKRLVLDGVDFHVVDAKTREDITRSILLQIISEEEEGGEPIFSSQLLAELIRAYGGNMQSMLTSYLEKSLELWGEQQRLFRERTREFMDHNPVSMLTQFAEQNLSVWRQLSGLDDEGKERSEDKEGAGSGGEGTDSAPRSARPSGKKGSRQGASKKRDSSRGE